ncbi:MAG: Asp-tRNA(Asn)/Glu-tRNA(Gln) amidotransferase subunit GatC [Candidatus Dadabacteria bacterium]|nr:MAG: Asp-tRNA(Asn)/Glu-tRNA(Gln) amidotransferase subunit GatC [Candidatus Dadabacteria bacterium]
MSEITGETVKKIAELSMLAVSEEELKPLAADLDNILSYVKKLDQLELKEVEPMSHVHGISNVFREDQVGETLDLTGLAENAPALQGRFFKVPLTVE